MRYVCECNVFLSFSLILLMVYLAVKRTKKPPLSSLKGVSVEAFSRFVGVWFGTPLWNRLQLLQMTPHCGVRPRTHYRKLSRRRQLISKLISPPVPRWSTYNVALLHTQHRKSHARTFLIRNTVSGPLSPRVTHGATRAAVTQVPHRDPECVCFVDWTAAAQLGRLFAEADGLSSYRGLILMNKESEKEAYIRQHM